MEDSTLTNVEISHDPVFPIKTCYISLKECIYCPCQAQLSVCL